MAIDFEAHFLINDVKATPNQDKIWRLFRLINIDDIFSRVADPLIINDTDFETGRFHEQITEAVYVENKEEISFIATCDCGYLDNRHIGNICPRCKTMSRSNFVDNLQHKVWLTTPPKIKAFIHPIFYLVLTNWLKGKGRYLDSILNPKGKLPPEIDEHIPGRGFNYFYDNFDYIINFFLNIYEGTKSKPVVPFIKDMLNKYRDVFFCTKLPIMSNKLHPITNKGRSLKYVDAGSKSILDAIIDLATIRMVAQSTNVKLRRCESIMYSAYISYINYCVDIVDNKLGQKKGHNRKHIFGSRMHGSLRAVIVPHVTYHRPDELHIPWTIAVNTYKHHILNRLKKKYRYKFNAAINKVHRALVAYDQDIMDILNKLIEDAGTWHTVNGKRTWVNYPGLPMYFNRNPSLSTGSIMLLFATKVHSDINNKSVRMSPMIVAKLNADTFCREYVVVEYSTGLLKLLLWQVTDKVIRLHTQLIELLETTTYLMSTTSVTV